MEQFVLNWGPERRHYTVGEFTERLRLLLAGEFTDVWIAGEISGTKLPASGHYYFTLKDHTAQLRAVCYKSSVRYLKFKPQDGVAVIARGRVDVYDARGEYQLIVEALEPQGLGALQLAFEQVKKRLAMEGLFEAARKCPLPALPQRIGIVTSPTGAVIRDMIEILGRRLPGRHIRLFPAQVQGEGSVGQVIEGIDYFGRSNWADLVIVARGGGSLEDLWTFNEESVARAIVRCPIPVVSAVGHETDFTIADFVADLRAPTPSAAAEMVVPSQTALLDRVAGCESKLRQAARLTLAMLGRRFHRVAIDHARVHRAIGKRSQRLDEMEYRMRDALRATVERRRRAVDSLASRLADRDVRLRLSLVQRRIEAATSAANQQMRLRMLHARGALAALQAHLGQLSPLKILERGYSIVERDGVVVKSPADAPPDSRVRVRLARGEIAARVVE